MKSQSTFLLVIIITLFNLQNSVVLGQVQFEIDSIKKLNRAESDRKVKVDNYNVISDLFTQSNSDSAFFYAEKALSLSKEIEYKWGEAEAYFMLSYYHNRFGETNEAIEKLEKACQLFKEVGDSSYLIGCYNNLGVFYSYDIDQIKSLEYFIKALNLAEALNETYSLSEAYSNIGSFYEYLREYSYALKYYEKALQLDIENEDIENIGLSYLYLGNIYLHLQLFDNALANLKKAQELMPEVKDLYRQAELSINLASYYVETQNADSANICLLNAIEVNSKVNYQSLEAEILVVKGDLLLLQKKYNECIQVCDQAISLFNQMQVNDRLVDLYKSKATAYSELGFLDKAYEMLLKANEVDESLKPNEIAIVLGEFEHAQSIKEEQARIKLEQELEIQKQENRLFQIQSKLKLAIVSIILLLLVLALFIYMYSLRRKYNKELKHNYQTIESQKKQLEINLKKIEENESRLKKLNATKDKFFSIIAHDLKSPFNALIGFSGYIINNPEVKNTENFDELISGIYQTANSGYSLLDNLLEWARTQTGNIDHDPEWLFLNDVFKHNIPLFKEIAKSKDIKINVDDPTDQKIFADRNALNCVMRNLLSNAVKFSYEKGKINISSYNENNFRVLKIQDFGTGMNEKTLEGLFNIKNSVKNNGTADEKGTGLGLILCKEFTERNGGEIWVESEEGKGSTFYCSFPSEEISLH